VSDILDRLRAYSTRWHPEDAVDLVDEAADEIERLRARDQHWNEHLGTAQAEIKRLTACLKWEQNWLERVGTHSPGCWQWGPGHYMCAVRHIEEMERG